MEAKKYSKSEASLIKNIASAWGKNEDEISEYHEAIAQIDKRQRILETSATKKLNLRYGLEYAQKGKTIIEWLKDANDFLDAIEKKGKDIRIEIPKVDPVIQNNSPALGKSEIVGGDTNNVSISKAKMKKKSLQKSNENDNEKSTPYSLIRIDTAIYNKAKALAKKSNMLPVPFVNALVDYALENWSDRKLDDLFKHYRKVRLDCLP